MNIFRHSAAFIAKHKNHHHIALASLALILSASGVYFYRNEFAQAATYTFTQSSWAGGITTATSTHTSNQTNWTQYSATSTGVTTAGGVGLTATGKTAGDDGVGLTALGTPTIATGSTPYGITISADGTSVYVANYDAATVSMYSRNATTGALTALATPTIAAGSNPLGITISPDGTSVYVTNWNSDTVSMYSRNTTTGALTALATPTIATGAYPTGITISADGTSVYVANYSFDTVSMYSRNATTGALTALGTPTIATGSNPRSTTISPDGTSVYVANASSDTVSMYSRNAYGGALGFEAGANASTLVTMSGAGAKVQLSSTGALTPLATPTIATLNSGPWGITISPDGTSAYARSYDIINMYSRNTSTGALTALATPTISMPGDPFGIVVSPDGTSVYAAGYGDNSVHMYSRNTTTGALTALATPTIAASPTPRGITISADGTSVYTANSGGTVNMYSRNTSTGALTALATPTIATGASPWWAITISPDGTSVYVANEGDNTVSMYSRNTTTGALTALATPTIAAGSGPDAVTISADGISVYVSNYWGNNVSMFSRNTTTGALTALATPLIAAGIQPWNITISADGTSVYVPNDGSNTVSMYSRNTTTGALTALATPTIATGSNPRGTTISPDGTSVYVTNANSNTVSMYSRNVVSSGTFTSAVIDTGLESYFTTLAYATTLNGQTITMDARAGNTATPDGSWTSWQTGIASGGSISGLAYNRYIQYRANFSTSNTTATPTLNSVTVSYNQYPTSGNLTSSKYDTESSAALISNILWSDVGTNSTAIVKFQVRSSPDGTTWTNWCGPATACDGTDYFTVKTGVSGGIVSGHPLNTGANDRYLQYKAFLLSPGSQTPNISSVSVQYVVNGPPVVSNITATQGSDGIVTVGYDVSDADNTIGNIVDVTLQYCTTNCTTGQEVWADAVTVSGNVGTGVALGTARSISWTPATDYANQYKSNTQKIRIKANDRDAANNLGYGTSGTFTLDTTAPTVTANFDSSGTQDVVNITATDNSTSTYRLCNTADFAACATWSAITSGVATTTSWTATGAPSDEVVYLQVRDLYGNVTARTLVAPAMPGSFAFTDASNVSIGIYREFLSWSPFVATTSSTFGSYKVYHSLNNFATAGTLLTTITDSAINYYAHTVTTATSSLQYYKVVAVNANGDVSNFTAVLSDIPDGTGGADTTPPYIPIAGIAAPTVGNSSANITFSTYTDSSLAVGELATSTVLYASYVGAVPSSCPGSPRVSTNTYTVNHSIYLTGLTPATQYYYCVIAKDISGNVSAATTATGGTFTTVSGPLITNVTERELTDVSALIFWNTNTSSDSKVYFSTTSGGVNGATPTTGAVVTVAGTDGAYQHQVGLTGLSAGQTYYYKVSSTDTATSSVTTTNDNNGQYYSFVTLRDTTPPTITGTSTPVLASNAAVIVWQTNELATTKVDYGTTSGVYDKGVAEDSNLSIYHVATLSSSTANDGSGGGVNTLVPETIYYYRVTSKDAANNSATATGTFTTPATGSVTITTINVVSNASTGADVKDTTPPSISNVTVSDITPFGATVKFGTSEDTVSEVGTGASISYGQNTSNFDWGTAHTIKLRGLTLGTEYHMRVRAIDKAGNIGASADQTFTTKFLTEGLDTANITNIEAFQKEIEAAIESILPSLVPPFVSKPSVGDITESGATITFKTNIKAFPVVVYADDGSYDETKDNPYTGEISDTASKTIDHSLILTGLKGNTKYHIQARAFSLPKVIGKSADVTFITKTSKIAGSIVERKKDSFTVVWTTDEPTSSIVEYKNARSGITERKTDDAKKTSHSMKIENLPPGTAYAVNISGLTEQGNIAEGGSSLSVTTSRDVTPPAISGFKVDNALIPGRTDRIQTIVSWTTDEPANSTAYYEEGTGTAGDTKELANKNAELASYTVTHSVILPSLKPGTIYRLKVTSSDDSGNLGSFGPRTIITPQQTASITDIIFKNFEDSFKFLKKI